MTCLKPFIVTALEMAYGAVKIAGQIVKAMVESQSARPCSDGETATPLMSTPALNQDGAGVVLTESFLFDANQA